MYREGEAISSTNTSHSTSGSDTGLLQTLVFAGVCLIGFGFVAAGVMKLKNPFFFSVHLLQPTYMASLVIDLILGACLVFFRKDPRVRGVGAVVCTAYGIYLLQGMYAGRWTCDCLGVNTPVYLSLAFDLTGVVVLLGSLVFCCSKQPLKDSSFTHASIFIVALFSITTTLLSLSYRSYESAADIRFEPQSCKTVSLTESGLWRGSVAIHNEQSAPCRIVGFSRSCQFMPEQKRQFTIPAGGSHRLGLSVRLPEDSKLAFAQGSVQVFYETGATATSTSGLRMAKIPWGIVVEQ